MERSGWENGSWQEKWTHCWQMENINIYFCVAFSSYFFISIHRVVDRLKTLFNLPCLIVRISYHIFSNLAEFINGDLAAKIRRWILSHDLMDREYNCSVPYKVNIKWVYEGKCRINCLIYEVKWSICEAIYIGKTQQKFNKIMGSHLSNVQCLLKKGIKLDSFADHYGQHFKSNMPCTNLHKRMSFKVVNHLNPIGSMKSFTKPNYNLCIE